MIMNEAKHITNADGRTLYMKTDDNLLLLKTEMDEGHFGGSDRYKYMKELAFSYVFVLKTMNMLDNN